MSPAFDPEQAAASIRFVTQHLSPEEIAAATAVLTTALREQSLAADQAVRHDTGLSAWSRSARGLRQPLRGDWRGFTAEGL